MKGCLFFLILLYCQNGVEKDIEFIRKHYALINEYAKNATPNEIDVFDESTEGGELKAYRGNKGEVRKIEMTYYGETGMIYEEYYFIEEELIFAFTQRHEYNRPIYWDKKYAEKYEDSEYFDPEKTQINEDRFYFKEYDMIRWIDANQDLRDEKDSEFDEMSEKVLKESIRLINKLD